MKTFEVSMVDLRLLRYFVAVAETEHVGRAAERLHVSQSPLSRQIRQLEQLLGVALFERTGRRIRLTDAGRELLPAARDLLGRADALVRDARASTGAGPGRIAVGFVSTALATGVLTKALRALRARHPDVHVELRHANSELQLALVRAGELDVALVHAAPGVRDLRALRLLEQPYRLAVSRSGPFGRRPLTPKVLGAAPWIAVRAGERARDRWLDACAVAGFVPRVAVEVADYASALALVEAGIGVAVVPASQGAISPTTILLRALGWLRLTAELWAVRAAHGSSLADELVHQLTR
jgi:DNA-binding transcriptional LysR family regulator